MEEARRVTRQQTSKPVLKYSNSNGNLSTQINSNYGNGHLATHIHSSYGNGHVPYPHQVSLSLWIAIEISHTLFIPTMANSVNKPVPIIGFCVMCKATLKYSLRSLARLSTLS